MTLQNLINKLEGMNQDGIVSHGFGAPDSWRGDYSEIAFEPKENAKISEMLAHAKSAVGATFEGYKGGEYVMKLSTSCHIAHWGEYGGASDGISRYLVDYWEKETQNEH